MSNNYTSQRNLRRAYASAKTALSKFRIPLPAVVSRLERTELIYQGSKSGRIRIFFRLKRDD